MTTQEKLHNKQLHNLEMRVINLFNALMDIDLVVPYILVNGSKVETLDYYKHITDEFHKAKDELMEFKQSRLRAVG